MAIVVNTVLFQVGRAIKYHLLQNAASIRFISGKIKYHGNDKYHGN